MLCYTHTHTHTHSHTHTHTHTHYFTCVDLGTCTLTIQTRMHPGPTAVMEAYGGTMSKLPGFLKDSTLEGYTHLLAATNLDFVPVLYML